MEEIFVDIKGYEGLYQISNLGRIKSLERQVIGKYNSIRTLKEFIMKPNIIKKGYLRINLHKNSKNKHFLVHQLVASHFIPNPNNYHCVNHKDEDKQNNCVDNLEWCDIEYNNNYGTRNERLSVAFTNNPKKSKPIIQLDKECNIINEYPSINEADRNGFSRSKIIDCCRGKRKTHKGFIWKYKNG